MTEGLAGESFLREQTARVRKRYKEQVPREKAKGPRYNPRNKSAPIEQ